MKEVPKTAAQVAFILVRPSHPGNIGAASRAIKTMGFTDLRVVNPKVENYKESADAIAFATSSADVLAEAKTFATLPEALEDVSQAFALSGYNREFGPPIEDLRTSVSRASAFLQLPESERKGGVAFVFGCERSGLTNEEMDMCQTCSAICANPASPSLNLAQAVQITAYEMQLALLTDHPHELYAWQDRFEHQPPAGPNALDGFYTHWQEAMIACGALDPKEPKNLMGISRRFFSRAGLTQSDVDMLRGICAAIIRSKKDRIGTKKR